MQVNKEKMKEIFKRALGSGLMPHQLALSCAWGVYIAFSPFPGLHTVMMFIIKWLFGLHFPLLFLVTSLNNPWTMIPFFSGDYLFGYWLVHDILKWEPGWHLSLEKIFGSGSICLWSFFVGGNILGIISGVITYPLALVIFKRMLRVQKEKLL